MTVPLSLNGRRYEELESEPGPRSRRGFAFAAESDSIRDQSNRIVWAVSRPSRPGRLHPVRRYRDNVIPMAQLQ